MEKTIQYNGKISDVPMSPIPPGERTVHRRYGLRITHHGRKVKFGPESRKQPRCFGFFSISHVLAGRVWYWHPDHGCREAHPGDVVIATPGQVMSYGADDCECMEDYICFVGPVANQLLSSGVIGDGVFHFGKPRRLLPIIEQAMNPADDSQIAANIALQSLLVDRYLSRRKDEVGHARDGIEALIEELQATPEKWWTVSEMAEFCSISETHFRKLFRNWTGLSPKRYLDQLKHNRAVELLCYTDLTVGQVAEKLGYVDPFHFSKTFKKLSGLSPSPYREQARRQLGGG